MSDARDDGRCFFYVPSLVTDTVLSAACCTSAFLCALGLQGGVVLGADTRATEGAVVADKNCSKIHFISSNI